MLRDVVVVRFTSVIYWKVAFPELRRRKPSRVPLFSNDIVAVIELKQRSSPLVVIDRESINVLQHIGIEKSGAHPPEACSVAGLMGQAYFRPNNSRKTRRMCPYPQMRDRGSPRIVP